MSPKKCQAISPALFVSQTNLLAKKKNSKLFTKKKKKSPTFKSSRRSTFFGHQLNRLATFVKEGFVGLQGFESIDVDTCSTGPPENRPMVFFYPHIWRTQKKEDLEDVVAFFFNNTLVSSVISGGFLVILDFLACLKRMVWLCVIES